MCHKPAVIINHHDRMNAEHDLGRWLWTAVNQDQREVGELEKATVSVARLDFLLAAFLFIIAHSPLATACAPSEDTNRLRAQPF